MNWTAAPKRRKKSDLRSKRAYEESFIPLFKHDHW